MDDLEISNDSWEPSRYCLKDKERINTTEMDSTPAPRTILIGHPSRPINEVYVTIVRQYGY